MKEDYNLDVDWRKYRRNGIRRGLLVGVSGIVVGGLLLYLHILPKITMAFIVGGGIAIIYSAYLSQKGARMYRNATRHDALITKHAKKSWPHLF